MLTELIKILNVGTLAAGVVIGAACVLLLQLIFRFLLSHWRAILLLCVIVGVVSLASLAFGIEHDPIIPLPAPAAQTAQPAEGGAGIGVGTWIVSGIGIGAWAGVKSLAYVRRMAKGGNKI